MPDWLQGLLDAPGNYVQSQAEKGVQDAVDRYIPFVVIGGGVLVLAVWLASR